MVAFAGVEGKFDYREQNVVTAMKVIKTVSTASNFRCSDTPSAMGRGDYRGEGAKEKTYLPTLFPNTEKIIINVQQLNINI